MGKWGERHPRYGKKATSEQRQRMSDCQKRRSSEPGYTPNGAKRVLNTKTNEEFSSIKSAADSIAMSVSTLKAMLNPKCKNPNTTNFIKIDL